MTNGTAAAMLLSDLIAGRENPWARLYDSTRSAPLTEKSLYKEGVSEAAHFAKDRLKGVGRGVADVTPGEGKVVGRPGDQTAVYRNPRGEVHPPGVHSLLEPCGEELGLPLPRVALLRGRRGDPRPGGA